MMPGITGEYDTCFGKTHACQTGTSGVSKVEAHSQTSTNNAPAVHTSHALTGLYFQEFTPTLHTTMAAPFRHARGVRGGRVGEGWGKGR